MDNPTASTPVSTIRSLVGIMLEEAHSALERVSERQVELLREALLTAKAIAVHGVGREGLVLRAFAMRLFHLGLPVGVVGDMTTGPLTSGGLLICSAGPGSFATVAAVAGCAKEAGARIAVLSAHVKEPLASLADMVVVIPARTMGEGGLQSRQPLGSAYEQALWLVLDAVVIQLMRMLQLTERDLAARHTNLE